MSEICRCISVVSRLPDCPAHGVFPTASKRVELEARIERALKALDAIVHELGVPGYDTPAPIGNAHDIARRALDAESMD